MELFYTICQACMVVGFAIPVINLIFGFFDGIDLDLNADASFDMDLGIGFSFMPFMLGIGIFGVVGLASTYKFSLPLAVLIALASGILAYVLVYKFIFKPLKKNRNRILATNGKELIGSMGKIILPITKNSNGTIITDDSTGASIKYMATASFDEIEKHSGRMDIGTDVVIIDVKDNLCIVKESTKVMVET